MCCRSCDRAIGQFETGSKIPKRIVCMYVCMYDVVVVVAAAVAVTIVIVLLLGGSSRRVVCGVWGTDRSGTDRSC